MPKIFETIAQPVLGMREQLPLLSRVDQVNFANLFLLAVGEVVELEEALSVTPEKIKEWAMEYSDVIVFLVSIAVALGVLDSTLSDPRIYSSNGEAKASSFYDQLIEVIFDAQDNPKALVEAFRLLHSFAHHVPISPAQLFGYMEPTVQKVLSNRPSEFFQPRDPQTGRTLTDEGEILQLYGHLEAMFRMIRKHVQRTLTPADWQPHRDLIGDWQNSDTARALLQQRLATQPKPHDFFLEEGTWYTTRTLSSGILVATQAS